MIQNSITMVVLVKGKPVIEYAHDNKVFIEGRGGSNYEIEIRNRTAGRIEAVVSVDGLSVTDGKPAGLLSRGYLLESHGVIRIPGWKLDGVSAAKFAFASKKDSYGTYVADGDSRNNGVIGLMAFVAIQPLAHSWYTPTINNLIQPMPLYSNTSIQRSMNISSSGYGVQMSAQASANCASDPAQWAAAPQSLGTAFGAATSFETREVEFNRGAMAASMSVFYDDLKGLRAKGVPIVRARKRPHPQSLPQAFPALQRGCTPPEHWKG